MRTQIVRYQNTNIEKRMKLTAFLLLTGLFISTNSLVYSQAVNINMAKDVAQNHLISVSRNQLKSASSNRPKYQFSSLSVTSESKDTLYFVLNDTINHSFVIVSGDKRSSPIIGYSLEGNYDVNNQPPAFVAWMENRKQEIESIKQNNFQADITITQQWDNLSSMNSEDPKATTFVEPLIKTKWDQGCYYNSMCPTDTESSYCGHVPTGCTITAMAQIMKYWNYPTNGTGSHSYLSADYGILSADFGATTYQWDQMPNVLTSQNDAVAKLMYHCGVSLDMKYNKGSSGAYDPRDELVKYFNYSPDAQMVYRNRFTTSDWIYILKSELDQQHPIYFEGYQNCESGHAFVCDGYQNNDYFHFNWGWGGSFDGYFYLGSLNPAGIDYNSNQAAIINLFPSSLPGGYNGLFVSTNNLNIGSNGGTGSIQISSSTNWMASTNQPFLSINSSTGISGTSTLILSVIENNTVSHRSASIIISAVGYMDQLITVNQPSKVMVTPGGLHDIIASMPTPITNLTLTGTIDARDFKTMRDDTTMLSELDLSDVTIVKYIGTEGTMNSNFTYPANTIPYKALYGSFLKNILLPKSVTSIDCIAFSECHELKNITISSTITSIGSNAFTSCNALINVDASNLNYSSIEGVLFNKTQTILIQCPESKAGTYTIPSTVISIEEMAFWYCNKLTTVLIPSSVTSIGSNAFHRSGITAITIPSSVTSIGDQAFYDCPALINVDASNPNYSSIEGALFNKAQTTLIQCPVSKTNFTIPSSVKAIGAFAFSFNDKLTRISLPSSVATFGTYAFLNCTGLNSIYASSISPVELNASNDVFGSVNKNSCILYVPSGTKSLYASAKQWRDFKNIVEISVPIAKAGSNQTINENSQFTLDGSASSAPGNEELTYFWTAPEGITLSSTTVAQPSFTTPEVTTDTNYTFSLTVYDGRMYSEDNQVIATVKQVNKAPVANAGTDAEITERKTFKLDGSQSSDFDKDVISYKWTAPLDITLSSTTAANPTFTAPNVHTNTTFTFNLVVNDGYVDSPADQVIVTIVPNQSPTAHAGMNQTVFENSWITLDGSASSDMNNDVLTYLWTTQEGITLSSTTVAKPGFKTPDVTTDTNYTFSLVVSDGSMNSTVDEIVISVLNVDRAPYVKNPIKDISVDKTAPDQIIDLQTVFGDYDLGDILYYIVTSNINDQVVTAEITGGSLTLSFSSENIGYSEIAIAASSKGKEVTTKFNVEVKIPTGIVSFSDQKFKLFPNPTNGKIKLEFDQIPFSGMELTVTDLKGKTILKQTNLGKDEWIDLTGNIPGLYLLKTNGNQAKVQKVVLK